MPPRRHFDRPARPVFKPNASWYVWAALIGCLFGWLLSDGGLAAAIAAGSSSAAVLMAFCLVLQTKQIDELEACVAKMRRMLDRLELRARQRARPAQIIEIVLPGRGFGKGRRQARRLRAA